MSDFEQRLRSELHTAAQRAPLFRGMPIRQTRRRRHRPTLVGAVVAVAAVMIGGLATTIFQGSNEETPAASCPALLRFDGRTYEGRGDLQRYPRTAGNLGRGTLLGCSDIPDDGRSTN
jgi:hypothetical protein